ncbi:MAG: alpha/beta hydrolase fold domain-containing protein [Streptomycetaceae bacterium]|nr:alpha/beta hydrolase fold domain-containing protein [Streptomycetaceae bacterium]
MTAFVLVSEAHTGGWIWRDVAARLRAAGEKAHPVTLTGMEDRGAGGPGTDLATHVEDVVRVVDHMTDGAQVVLVGHGYGIHPVLGAAGRRPERIARIVYLDAGMAQDGEPAVKLVPDGTVHQRLRTPGDEPIEPPAGEEWQRWGSLDGVPDDALDRLTRLAAPQPRGTLTQPLEVPDAVAELPTTGILCTANGASIDMVQMLVGVGDPRIVALTEPHVRFLELATGHWPMLSVPAELADTLRGAAAGEGHRLTAPAPEQAPHLRPFLLDVAERPLERIGHVDLHLPDTATRPSPAVIFIHGGPVPANLPHTPRDWSSFLGYARYAASLGAVGVTVDHRLHDLADFPRAAEDVAAAVDLVRTHPRVDPDRIALWFVSAGGLLSAEWLAAPPPWLRCVAASYPVLAPLPSWGHIDSPFRPAEAIRTAADLPIVLTRAGREMPEIATTVEEFLTAADEAKAAVEVIDAPHAHHGFETRDYEPAHAEENRNAVRRAMRSVLAHLR